MKSKMKKVSVWLVAIMLFLSMVTLSFRNVSEKWGEEARADAFITVFYEENLNTYSAEALRVAIKDVEGVLNLHEVSAEEAEADMRKQLGDAASVLDLYEETPFLPYYALDIDISKRSSVIDAIKRLPNVMEINDNQQALDFIDNVSNRVSVIGLTLVAIMLSVTGLIVYFNASESINKSAQVLETYALLGAMPLPTWKPYLIQSLKELGIATASAVTLFLFAYYLVFKKAIASLTLFQVDAGAMNPYETLIIVSVMATVLGISSSYRAFIKVYKQYW